MSKIRLDKDSLAGALDQVNALADDIKQRASSTSGISLSEIQLELGVSATGKVGILGVGMDLQCAAKLQIKFRVQ